MTTTTKLAEYHNPAPVAIVQFGGGVFMRGFLNWMLQQINDQNDDQEHADMTTAVIKLTPGGTLDSYQQQQGVFQHIIRGMDQGAVVNRSQRINTIAQWIHPYEAWDDFLALAESPDLRAVFSNSTEAGIVYETCPLPSECPLSFPAKLCVFLYRRFQKSLPGLWIFPCELIEDNAQTLLDIVIHHAQDWRLNASFVSWLQDENTWVNTLVDRIVAAPSADERAQIQSKTGITDNLLNSSEPYHIFVLDCDDSCESIIPFQKAGLNIVYTDNLQSYRERKVKLLNGAHTSMLFLSYMRGNNTVEESLNDTAVEEFLRSCLYTNIIPTIDMNKDELKEYADTVLERFRNPFLKHQLLSISLNSISKIRYRILQTIEDYYAQFQSLPAHLMLGLSAFLRFYDVQLTDGIYVGQRGDESHQLGDNHDHIALIVNMWQNINAGMDAEQALSGLFSREDIWGSDISRLPEFAEMLAKYIEVLQESSLEELLHTMSA